MVQVREYVTVTQQQQCIISLGHEDAHNDVENTEDCVMPKTRAVIALAAIVIIIVAAFAFYAGVTYPRTLVTVPVSLTIGVDVTNTQFDQPTLDNKVQVQISIQNGAALWRARILNSDQVIWEHAAAQGEQESYNSGWLDLPSGTYNFTFATLSGSLDATATLSAKGGFW